MMGRLVSVPLCNFILFIQSFFLLHVYAEEGDSIRKRVCTGHYQKMEESVSLLIFSHPRPPLCCFSVNNTN